MMDLTVAFFCNLYVMVVTGDFLFNLYELAILGFFKGIESGGGGRAEVKDERGRGKKAEIRVCRRRGGVGL